MRRCVLFALIFALFLCAAPARAEGVITLTEYDAVIKFLCNPENRENIEMANQGLKSATLYSDYENVRFLRLYAQALLLVHENALVDARFNCKTMGRFKGYEEFQSFLIEKNMLSVEDLLTYIAAREAEASGDWAACERLYTEYPAMDSMERVMNLARVTYPAELARAQARMTRGSTQPQGTRLKSLRK